MESTAAMPRRAPWHLWVVGGLGILWNAMGAFDFVMTQTRNASYMSSFTPEQLEYFNGFPAWVVVTWAVAVWGGVLGTALVLLRNSMAVPVLLASFLAMVVTAAHNFLLTDGLEVMGTGGAAFSALIFVFALGLWLYARAMAGRGVLT